MKNTFNISSYLFIRLLAIVYLIAFVSFWSQAIGLIGSNGILPVEEFISSNNGIQGFLNYPSIFFVNSSDFFLHLICLVGLVCSVLVFLGFIQGPCLLILWFLYLSIVNVSQVFMTYQWDYLLLETGFLTLFIAPWNLSSLLRGDLRASLADFNPPRIFIFLFHLLLFKLMICSGLVKFWGPDESWKSLTALNFHYETQPLPNWISWNLHQLPEQFHQLCVKLVFFIEIVVPFLIFGPRLVRNFSFITLVLFQLTLMLSGNFAFFNVLAITLCFLLLDDEVLGKQFSFYSGSKNSSKRAPSWFKGNIKISIQQILVIIIGISLVLLSVLQVASLPGKLPKFVSSVLTKTSNLGINSRYGLFSFMTKSRPEIIIEGSVDGTHWKAYEFKWKPGNLAKAPGFAIPHQPRLDWQMWFAALGDIDQNLWLNNFMLRLIQGSPSVKNLLEFNPFPEKPPNYVRAVLYNYNFTDATIKEEEDGAWWRREFKGLYAPVVSKFNSSK
ncbi:MAG: lipase maturation factor family protein [Candidatus Caenarcaniphilales bacterium]|nr:lipase maturation factor family protein [Candidatus Caenarcaniphilales bacterium]